MQYTAIVRRQSTGKFRATAPAVLGCIGKGNTRKEALDQLRVIIESWLLESEVTTIEISLPLVSNGKIKQNAWLTMPYLFSNASPSPAHPIEGTLLYQAYQTYYTNRAPEEIAEETEIMSDFAYADAEVAQRLEP